MTPRGEQMYRRQHSVELATQGQVFDGRRERHRIPVALGAALREARQRQGLSVRQWGAEIALSQGQVGCIEGGQAAPSVAVARSLIYALALPADIAAALMQHAVPGVGRSRWC